jgi:hypothetical protein
MEFGLLYQAFSKGELWVLKLLNIAISLGPFWNGGIFFPVLAFCYEIIIGSQRNYCYITMQHIIQLKASNERTYNIIIGSNHIF